MFNLNFYRFVLIPCIHGLEFLIERRSPAITVLVHVFGEFSLIQIYV